MFPVHLFDNAFAGAALYGDHFTIANTVATRTVTPPYDCSSVMVSGPPGEKPAYAGYNFKYQIIPGIQQSFQWLLDLYGIPGYLDLDRQADCNPRGLTEKGEILLNTMMDKGMLIDIDHMSHVTMEGVPGSPRNALSIFEERNYPPISSHTVVTPDGKAGSEYGMVETRARRIARMGGFIAINPPRPGHDDHPAHGTTEEFVHGHRVNGELAALGYNGIVDLVRNAYEGDPDDDSDDMDTDYLRIGLAGDHGCFVNQVGPRFKGIDGNYFPRDLESISLTPHS
jgi:hypothetical protein